MRGNVVVLSFVCSLIESTQALQRLGMSYAATRRAVGPSGAVKHKNHFARRAMAASE